MLFLLLIYYLNKMEKNYKLCEICKSDATSLCLQCISYFCDGCYKFIHDKKENSSHKKEKIDYYVPIDTKCRDHNKVPINLFCLDDKGNYTILINLFFLIFIELCCSFCFFKNLHYGHKVLAIDEEEELKKENITIENSSNEFNENTQKIIKLKNTIEKEITEIDKLFEKVKSEATNSYNKKREKLDNEEKELKDKLQTEVTKIKEQLELFLSESNKLIKISEKINKGIKAFEKEEKKMIKTL